MLLCMLPFDITIAGTGKTKGKGEGPRDKKQKPTTVARAGNGRTIGSKTNATQVVYTLRNPPPPTLMRLMNTMITFRHIYKPLVLLLAVLCFIPGASRADVNVVSSSVTSYLSCGNPATLDRRQHLFCGTTEQDTTRRFTRVKLTIRGRPSEFNGGSQTGTSGRVAQSFEIVGPNNSPALHYMAALAPESLDRVPLSMETLQYCGGYPHCTLPIDPNSRLPGGLRMHVTGFPLKMAQPLTQSLEEYQPRIPYAYGFDRIGSGDFGTNTLPNVLRNLDSADLADFQNNTMNGTCSCRPVNWDPVHGDRCGKRSHITARDIAIDAPFTDRVYGTHPDILDPVGHGLWATSARSEVPTTSAECTGLLCYPCANGTYTSTEQTLLRAFPIGPGCYVERIANETTARVWLDVEVTVQNTRADTNHTLRLFGPPGSAGTDDRKFLRASFGRPRLVSKSGTPLTPTPAATEAFNGFATSIGKGLIVSCPSNSLINSAVDMGPDNPWSSNNAGIHLPIPTRIGMAGSYMTDGPSHDYPWFYLSSEDAEAILGSGNCTLRDIGSTAPNECKYTSPGLTDNYLDGAGVPGFAANDTKLSPARILSILNEWRREAFNYLSTEKTLGGYNVSQYLPPHWNITHPGVWPVSSPYAPQFRHFLLFEPPVDSLPPSAAYLEFDITIDISTDAVGYSEPMSSVRRNQVNFKSEAAVDSGVSDDGDDATVPTPQAAVPTAILSRTTCGVMKPDGPPEGLSPIAEYTFAVFTATLCNNNAVDETYNVELCCPAEDDGSDIVVAPAARHTNVSLSSRPDSGLPACATVHSPVVTIAKNFDTGAISVLLNDGRRLNASLCMAVVRDADSDVIFIPILSTNGYDSDNWSYLGSTGELGQASIADLADMGLQCDDPGTVITQFDFGVDQPDVQKLDNDDDDIWKAAIIWSSVIGAAMTGLLIMVLVTCCYYADSTTTVA